MQSRRIISVVGLFIGLGILLGMAMFMGMMIGPVQLTAAGEALQSLILWEIRFPRLMMGLLVGGALGLAGAGYQGILRNPLADPYILGVSSGAGLGAALVMMGGGGSVLGVMMGAVVGGFLAISAVSIIVTRSRVFHPTQYILAGIVVNAFFGAVMMLVLYLAQSEVSQIMGWLMGDLGRLTVTEVLGVLPCFVLGALCLGWFARPLNVLVLGDQTAVSVGVDVKRVRFWVFVWASVLTGLAVAVAGMIGFIGLIVPHMIRLVYKDDFRILLPASFLGGAILLIVSDIFSRGVWGGIELPVGIITAMIGGPFFVYLLKGAPK